MSSYMKKSILFSVFILPLLLFFSCKKEPTLTVKLLTDGPGINDKSFNAKAWQGILKFYNEEWGNEEYFGTLYDVIPCRESGTWTSTLRKVSEEKPDLIIITSFIFSGSVQYIGPVFPEQKYLCIDGNSFGYPNVRNYLFASEEGSFLVGAAAALRAQKDDIQYPAFGFIGGVEGDVITDFEVGFVQGVRHILPGAHIFVHYVNDWAKPELAAAITKKWYDSGIYAVYSAAGASGNGTIAQAIAHRKAGKNVWAIGVDSDQHEEGIYGVGKSAVRTSMVKNVDAAVLAGLNDVAKGTFTGGSVIIGLKENGVGFTTTNPDLKDDVVKRLNSIRSDIITGKITVASTYTDREKVSEILKTVTME